MKTTQEMIDLFQNFLDEYDKYFENLNKVLALENLCINVLDFDKGDSISSREECIIIICSIEHFKEIIKKMETMGDINDFYMEIEYFLKVDKESSIKFLSGNSYNNKYEILLRLKEDENFQGKIKILTERYKLQQSVKSDKKTTKSKVNKI